MPQQQVREYRRRAREALELARKLPPGEQRDAMLVIAELWDNLARKLEAKIKKDQPK